MSAAEVLKIDLEGPGGSWDKPRNKRRVVLEVDVAPGSGTTVLGRRLRKGVNRLEVYEDQVDQVLARVQTSQHQAYLEQAREISEIKREEWASEVLRKVTGEERDKRMATECPYNEYTEVVIFPGMKRGVPPLKRVSFVKADGSVVADFGKLTDADFDAPPLTPENSAERAANVQAQAFVDGLRLLREEEKGSGRGGNGKGR